MVTLGAGFGTGRRRDDIIHIRLPEGVAGVTERNVMGAARAITTRVVPPLALTASPTDAAWMVVTQDHELL